MDTEANSTPTLTIWLLRSFCPSEVSSSNFHKATQHVYIEIKLYHNHHDNQHLQDYMVATEGALEEFTLNEMTRIA